LKKEDVDRCCAFVQASLEDQKQVRARRESTASCHVEHFIFFYVCGRIRSIGPHLKKSNFRAVSLYLPLQPASPISSMYFRVAFVVPKQAAMDAAAGTKRSHRARKGSQRPSGGGSLPLVGESNQGAAAGKGKPKKAHKSLDVKAMRVYA
jgi:hypothetical protein